MALTVPTLASIVERVILRVSMVGGIGVQTYAEDVIAEMVIHKFDLLFDKFRFPGIMNTYAGVLGSDGKCNADVTDTTTGPGLQRFKDLCEVWYKDDRHPLKQLPNSYNSNQLAIAGTRPTFVEASNDNKIFRVLGLGSVGDTLTVRHKVYPEEIVATTELKVDAQALILGAAFDYLSDDDSNPTGIEKMRRLYNQRIEQLISDSSNMPIHDPRAGSAHAGPESSGYQVVR